LTRDPETSALAASSVAITRQRCRGGHRFQRFARTRSAAFGTARPAAAA